MKRITTHPACLFLLAGIAATASIANAATLVLDDFSQGAFSLQHDGSTAILEDVHTPLTDRRAASGSRTMDWQAVLASGSGVMTYTLSLTDDPTDRSNYLTLAYARKSGGFSILGYEAFSLTITALSGQGEVMAYIGYTPNGISMPITGTGEMVIPYSMLNTTTPLGDVASLRFQIVGLSSDFSVTLDRIALVPESGSLGLFAGGMAILLAKRRRRRA